MGSSKGLVSVIFLMLVLLMATDMEPMVAEARTCEALSHSFRGLCFSDRNCANVCHNEGFTGGDCHGARRRCFCTKPC